MNAPLSSDDCENVKLEVAIDITGFSHTHSHTHTHTQIYIYIY